MARSAIATGLNDITALDSHDNHKMTDDHGTHIPKLNFGFRRTLQAPSTRNDVARSAPNSNESSPNLSRSRSLRLPRNPYPLKSHSSSALDRERVLDYERGLDRERRREGGGGNYRHQRGLSHERDVYPEPHVSHLKPRSSSGSSSNPSSRGSSPGTSIPIPHRNNQTESYSMSQEYIDSPRSNSSSPGLQRRSQSFSSRQRYQGNVRHPRTGSVNLREKGSTTAAARPSQRSKTPTASTTARIAGPAYRQKAGSEPRKVVSRTSSTGYISRAHPSSHTSSPSHHPSPSPSHAPSYHVSSSTTARVPLRRTESGDSASSQGSSLGIRNSGTRPRSTYARDGTADLNKLAHEISGSHRASESDYDLTGDSATESQTSTASTTGRSKTPTSRIPMIRRANSPYDRSNTPSPTHKSVPVSASTSSSAATTTSAASGTNARSYEQPTRSSQARLAAKMEKQSSLEKDRPSSARGNHAHHPMELYRPRSVTGINYDDVRTRSQKPNEGRPSTPPVTSGRTTPGQKTEPARQPLGGRSRASPTPGDTPRSTGLPPRTPYRVLARARASAIAGSGVGINELEGSVLLEADDYRKISNEVKALKTSLLKLKRELQGELQGSSPSASPATSIKSRRGSPQSSSGPTLAELTKKMDQMAAERDKALEEVSKHKKEAKVRATRIEQLASELEQGKSEKGEISDQLKQMEAHRDYLLDKVERLHADKHKLEDKLNSLEKARIYERTLSESESTWLDELDGAGSAGSGKKGDSVERKETESDIGESLMLSDSGEGESSEPESAAVCSTPVT